MLAPDWLDKFNTYVTRQEMTVMKVQVQKVQLQKVQLQKVQAGFTLIELMIVVVVISLLSFIALPSYTETTRKTKRADGIAAMMEIAQALERCYTSYGKYNSAKCTAKVNNVVIANAAKVLSVKKEYEITIVSTDSTYTLTGVPKTASQLKDLKCTSFILDNTGKKSATGTDSTKCW